MFGYYKFRRKIKNFLDLKKALKTQNKHSLVKSNDELYLFGNGYTLNETINIESIEGKDIFVCNELFLHQDYNKLIKSNNVFHFAMDGLRSFEKLIPKMEGITIDEAFKKYLNPILNSKVYAIIPLDLTRHVLMNHPKANYIQAEILKRGLIKLSKVSKKRLDKINLGESHTPNFMILVGILMGYKKIHLHGLEHNYVKDILNKDVRCGTHFYGESYKQVLELNMGKDLPRESYRTQLSKLFEGNAKVFRVYEELAELAGELGVEIIDHSGGSLFMYQDYSLWDLVEPPKKEKLNYSEL
jgi:hypothetical protein